MNKWHHIAATFDKGVVTISRNAVKSKLSAVGLQCVKDSQSIGDFIIGKTFHGVIDDVIIYDRMLSQKEISRLHQLQPYCD